MIKNVVPTGWACSNVVVLQLVLCRSCVMGYQIDSQFR